jgi:hypothetical protein
MKLEMSYNRTNFKARRLTILLALTVICAFTLTHPVPVDAAEPVTIATGDLSATSTTTISPSITVPFNLTSTTQEVYGGSVQVQQYKGGLWVKFSETYFSTDSDKKTISGEINLFKGVDAVEAGTYKLRLNVNFDGGMYSKEFSVTTTKVTTTFNIGKIAHVGKFQSYYYSYLSDELYYEVKNKEISVTWPGYKNNGGNVHLQRKDGSKWVDITTTSTYAYESSYTKALTVTIKQQTPAVKQYRLYVPANTYTTGGTSAIFKVSGKKQDPKFTVKYSATSQKYKKAGVKITLKTKQSLTGKVTIYDGTKAIKTLTLKQGAATYTLPKTLKVGTHKIKAKFVATSDDKGFFADKTTAVKKIVVKK